MSKYKGRLSLVVTLALLLSLVVTPAVQGQVTRDFFDWVIARTLTVRNTAVVQDGGLTLTDDDLTISSGNIDLAGNLTLSTAGVITVTNGATLTPLGSYQPLAAAGAVGFGAITAGEEGTVLTLVNTVNQTITITDTGTLKLSGNAALGQFDAITLISDGTNWIQVAPEGDN